MKYIVAVRRIIFALRLHHSLSFEFPPSISRAATRITAPCAHPTYHDIRQRQLPELILEPRRSAPSAKHEAPRRHRHFQLRGQFRSLVRTLCVCQGIQSGNHISYIYIYICHIRT
jgi:hypothetical protein